MDFWLHRTLTTLDRRVSLSKEHILVPIELKTQWETRSWVKGEDSYQATLALWWGAEIWSPYQKICWFSNQEMACSGSHGCSTSPLAYRRGKTAIRFLERHNTKEIPTGPQTSTFPMHLLIHWTLFWPQWIGLVCDLNIGDNYFRTPGHWCAITGRLWRQL